MQFCEAMDQEVTIRKDETKETKTFKWYHVNFDSLASKLAYFFEYVRFMTYIPNLVLFLTGIGMSKTESGIVMGLRSIGQIVGGPFWGIIADKWSCHRLVIVAMCTFSVLSMLSQGLVAHYKGNPTVNKCPEPHFASNETNEIIHNTTDLQNATIDSHHLSDHTGATPSLFWAIFMLQIAFSFSEGNAGFIDAATLRKSEVSTTRKIEYCRQRMFGAIGGGTGVLVGNLAVHNSPISGLTCYGGFLIPYAIMAVATAVALQFLYRGIELPKKKFSKNDEDFRGILIQTLLRRDVLLFLVVTFAAGMVDTPVRFLYVYLKELNSPKALYTISFVAAATAAFFGYLFSINMITFFGSTWKAMAFSFIAYGVRHLGYLSAHFNPWLVVLCEILHTISFSLFVTSGIYHIKAVSPAPIITTMSAIFNTLFFAVGPMVGLPLCGFVYDQYGSTTLFVTFFSMEFIIGVCLGILSLFFFQKNRRRKQTHVHQLDSLLTTAQGHS